MLSILQPQIGTGLALERLIESQKALGIKITHDITQLEKTIHRSLQTYLNDNRRTEWPPSLGCSLSNLHSETSTLFKQICIIKSLDFPQLFEREDNIKEAHPGTFEWLFEERSTNNDMSGPSDILSWLHRGSGVFWISGKAGSGKSTLMKFFYNSKQTISALEHWASGRNLIIASFFFWNSGTTMQKTQNGLFRTLLYHIFKQDPALIPSVCPSRWTNCHDFNSPWRVSDITKAFARLQTQDMNSVRFCFFLDGLDEYEGSHSDIINALNDLVTSESIKICFSSRPWRVFENSYGSEGSLKIRLQDFTRNDIARFAREKLAEGTQCTRLNATGIGYETIVREIVDRSSGE